MFYTILATDGDKYSVNPAHIECIKWGLYSPEIDELVATTVCLASGKEIEIDHRETINHKFFANLCGHEWESNLG